MNLTQEKLKELLDYDYETGLFTWRIKRQGIKYGYTAGFLDVKGYWSIKIYGKNYKAHRLVFLYIDGYLPENGLDHIDRDKLNNRRNNLREVSQTCNMRNQKLKNTNKSGITGVSWDKNCNKWKAKITTSKQNSLGYFSNIIDAAKARW